jgi:hypothetical protein
MPVRLIACISLPPETTTSVPISDYAEANEEWLVCIRKNIFYVAGRAFEKVANTPSKLAKQLKSWLER